MSKVVKDDVKEFKDDVKAQFARVDERFDEFELSLRRMEAYSRNNNLRNPTLRFNPIVSFQAGRGIIQPDPLQYSRNAKEFYSLRDCRNGHQKRMLAYLITFYDLPYTTWRRYLASDEDASDDASDDAPDNNSDMTIEDAVHYHSDLAIDLLESILGLNPENFAKFQQRAVELRQDTPQPVKRSHNVPATIVQKRNALETRPLPLNIRLGPDAGPEAEEDDKSGSTRVGWRDDTTPSAGRKLRRDLHNSR